MASFFFSNDESATAGVSAHKRPKLTAISTARTPEQSSGHDDNVNGLGARRTEVAPPSLFSRSRPQWKTWLGGFWRWLWDMDELPRTLAPATGLRKVKSEFHAAMWDLQSLRANQVRDLVETARSLRELWHLRADVFKVISVHRGQIEAQLRLDALDAHFPLRSSRRTDEHRHGKVTTW